MLWPDLVAGSLQRLGAAPPLAVLPMSVVDSAVQQSAGERQGTTTTNGRSELLPRGPVDTHFP